MYETLIFGILLIMFNFIFIVKRVPLIAFPVGLLTLIICATTFVNDTTLPVNNPNPYFTILIGLFAGISLLSQVLELGKK